MEKERREVLTVKDYFLNICKFLHEIFLSNRNVFCPELLRRRNDASCHVMQLSRGHLE